MAVLRKDLCADALVGSIRKSFSKIPDERNRRSISMPDILMSGYAIFSLKYPSLLAFDKERTMEEPCSGNMHSLFGISQIPSDTYLREVIDEVDPSTFRPIFKNLFSVVQRGKVLRDFAYLDDHFLVSMDGTGLFSSNEVHCASCMVKQSKADGKSYYHQMLGMVMVHPDRKAVLPLCPEPILNPDGQAKNDCERNAAQRLLKKFREDHPKLKTIILEDGLASNAPHIRTLKELNLSFILGAKPGDHAHLFELADLAGTAELCLELTGENGIVHRFRFINDLELNASSPDVRVNLLRYEQFEPKTSKTTKWSWVTDLNLSEQNVYKIMRAGRARWRIENETFNTLKNQGYNFEHNYGHGKKHLCTNFAMLMFLAFAVDQIQLIACKSFQEARQRCSTFYQYCAEILACFRQFSIPNWHALLQYIAKPIRIPLPQAPPS
jgi:hypothetical protein